MKAIGPREGTLAHTLMLWRDTGLLFALLVIGLWLVTLRHALFRHTLNPWTTPLLFLAVNHLYTGLLITAHDAIHGTVCSLKSVNDGIGRFCLMVFAGFDYDFLREEHWRHHSHAGLLHQDPDFHRGDASIPQWFLGFILHYVSLAQVVKLHVIIYTLFFLGAPMQNLIVFNALGGMSSAMILFYYGTYIPHRPDPPALEKPEGFRTLDKAKDTRLTSFLKCYNFGCHKEHHANPRVPWWALYDAYLGA